MLASQLSSRPSSSTTAGKDDSLSMLEFFSGIGGMRVAVDAALLHDDSSRKISDCQAYDISLYANQTYAHNLDTNVSTKLVEQLREVPAADLWTLSPPCQPFTTTRGAKSLDLDDARCAGLKGIMRLLNGADPKPTWIFLENVQGFATSQMCHAWKKCLRQNGYGYREYLLSPVQFGIPNHRLRYYILCELMSTRWPVVDDGDDDNHEESSALDRLCRDPPSQSSPLFSRPPRAIGEYVDFSMSQADVQGFVVPDTTLEKPWARQLGVVAGGDIATHCFTAGYGRILSRSTGSLLLFRDTEADTRTKAVADSPIDRTNMLQYSGRLRRFTPQELLRLFGFPQSFAFPPGINQDNQYKLVGNSINVFVVSELFKVMLLSDLKNDTEDAPEDESKVPIVDGMLSIGGTKGHIQESISGNLLRLYQAFRWKPLPNCTGRYTCREHHVASKLSPLELLESANIQSLEDTESRAIAVYSFDLPGRSDRVLVVPLDSCNQTGVISFEKVQDKDGGSCTTYVHTLNSPSGFRRKLNAIGISGVTHDDIRIDSNF